MAAPENPEDDDPFFYYDSYGNKLDPDSIKRRAVFRIIERLTPEEFLESLVRAGICYPDGSLTEPYRSDGEPSKYRPTD
jgi:hypothetical protein